MEVFNIITLEFLREAESAHPFHAQIVPAELANKYKDIFEDLDDSELENIIYATKAELVKLGILQDFGSSDDDCLVKLGTQGYALLNNKVIALNERKTLAQYIRSLPPKAIDSSIPLVIKELYDSLCK